MVRSLRITCSALLAVLLGAIAACDSRQVKAPSPIAGDEASKEPEIFAAQPDDSTTKDDPSAYAFTALSLVEVGAIDQPVDAASRTGDDGVYFVSRTGTIHRLVGEAFETDPVLDISDLTEGDGERGLLGLAFSNNGATAYLNYTNLDGDTTVASLAVTPTGQFNRTTLRRLLVVDQPFRNHNAGDIVVEPGGTLLIPMGDGGSADDPQRLALDDRSMLGKVLRLDPQSGEVTVLAKGLRNPWRVDLFEDRLWLADVGQNKFEEISVLENVSTRIGSPFKGASGVGSSTKATAKTSVVDFGWSAYEADMRFNKDQSSPSHTPPLIAYRHGENGCSISGGAVAMRGELRDRYIFADYCSGRVWSVATDSSSAEMQLHFVDLDSPTAVVRAHDGIFVLSIGGKIWRLNG